MPTHPDQWEIVKSLFEAALEENLSRRSAFLAERCQDVGVRAEVERLLAEYEQAGSFLSAPMLGSGQPRRLAEGRVLAGRFRVFRFIAAGGMGEVYEAEDLELRERVAIKTIRPDILTQPNAVARFKREVHLARKVTHPNVCRIYDLFRHKDEADSETQETIFISMELLYGETLSERLNRHGRVNPDQALPIVRQMAAALTAAHAVGIVHRDFKPSNVVLVDAPGQQRAVVTDFGLALQPVQSEEGTSLSTSAGLLGTPAYMAPEQLEGRPATISSDIYSLGLVIYEIVTGARPFQGETPMSAAMKRLSEPPAPPRKFEPKLNPQWEAVILRCLEREPAKRFLRAEDIGGFLAGNQAATPTAWAAERPYSQRLMISTATLAVVLAMAGAYLYAHRPPKLTEKDTIVLAEFNNKTGDAVFDDALKQGLAVELGQSPFLNILSDRKVSETLRMMGRPTNEHITADVGRELCLRTGSKALLGGMISSLGSHYVIDLDAVACGTGDTLAKEQGEATSKEDVLKALSRASSRLRSKLGESLPSVQRFDVPIEATTSSLEALKAYSMGITIVREKGAAAGIPFFERAIELDPNFPMAYAWLFVSYENLFQPSLALEYATKAYALRDGVSEREKLRISADYFHATGELEKETQTYELWIANYPRDMTPHSNLAVNYIYMGQYDKALTEDREALRLYPDALDTYVNLGGTYLNLNRIDQAKVTFDQAFGHKLEGGLLRANLYLLGFMRGDTTQMEEQVAWGMGKPGDEDLLLSIQSDTEAYYGRLRKAQDFSHRAAHSAVRSASKEAAALWQVNAALREAELGIAGSAREGATAALALSPGRDVKVAAALTLARVGDAPRTKMLAEELEKSYPLNTILKLYWLPTINAALEINKGNPSQALVNLEAATAYELGTPPQMITGTLYPAYLRGEAYLQAHNGTAATAEFQKLLDHKGIVQNFVTGALAHLQIGRAYAMAGDAAKAKAAYQDFLTLWKDADSDIPILKQAKAEYAKLQ